MELKNQSIGSVLSENAKNYGEREAVIYVNDKIRLTWKKLDVLTNQIAKGLMDLGVQRGDHVAMWGTNKMQWFLTQLAAARIGAPLVTINPEWKASELHYALKQSDTKVLVMTEGFEKQSDHKSHRYDYVKILQEVIPDLSTQNLESIKSREFPSLKNIVITSKDAPKGVLPWEVLFRRSKNITEKNFNSRIKSVSPSDICLIQYTSGTTGFPKGAMLTHHNVLNNAWMAGNNMNLSFEDKLCGPVPYYHCFGSILVNLVCLAHGATIVIPAEHFHPTKTLKAVEQEKCTALHGVPTMFITELADPKRKSFDLSSLRTGIIAGAPCATELMEAIVNDLGLSEVTIGYGLTEASPLTHQTLPSDSIEQRVSTVGRTYPMTQARIMDPSQFVELGEEEVGEIWVSGYHVMAGYYEKPEETEAAIQNGWLRTGDLGKRDANGYYSIVGRLKELIIVGGHNVYPAEIEQQLLSLFEDKVESIYVVGLPDPKLQEVVGAVAKLKPNQQLAAEELMARCEGQMEWPKIPRHLEIVEDFSMAMTVTGKVQKFKLKELFGSPDPRKRPPEVSL